MSEQVI